jgi:hypothetical protein
MFQVEPAPSPTIYTRSISFVSSCKWETHVPVPTSQYTSENLTNSVDTICKSSLIYPSFLKHGLHNSYLTFPVLTASIRTAPAKTDSPAASSKPPSISNPVLHYLSRRSADGETMSTIFADVTFVFACSDHQSNLGTLWTFDKPTPQSLRQAFCCFFFQFVFLKNHILGH